jgi:hypothetical protein
LVDLNTSEYANAIESGYWDSLAGHLQEFASQVLVAANGPEPVGLSYFGIEEVPALIALGAYLGDEHRIGGRDYNRDTESFAWRQNDAPVALQIVGLPSEKVEAAGEVVIRVELSYPIKSGDVNEVVSLGELLADIVIRPTDQNPRVGLLGSQADVEHFRETFRTVLAAIDNARPGTQLIHLFLAGSVSACLAAGQELRLRNGRRIQTYRYRAKDQPAMSEAILLTPSATAALESPLTDEDRLEAATARRVWAEALGDLVKHAKLLRDASKGAENYWPSYLLPCLASSYVGTTLLPRIWELVTERDTVSLRHHPEFAFDDKTRQWRFDDRTMVMMSKASEGAVDKMGRLARAFFWHEYLHLFQDLTRYTAAGVGGFPNCLERVDYVADLYGVLHQADYVLRSQQQANEGEVIAVLSQCITEAIDSFWTFELPPPMHWWQQRRLRRYLNWYWRREQIQHEDVLEKSMEYLCQPPVIEISGLPLGTDRRRIFLDLSMTGKSSQLEIGLVSENNKLVRCPNGPTLSIVEALKAFAEHDRDKIDEFFAALYDHAKP